MRNFLFGKCARAIFVECQTRLCEDNLALAQLEIPSAFEREHERGTNLLKKRFRCCILTLRSTPFFARFVWLWLVVGADLLEEKSTADCLVLIRCERKILLIDWLISQTNKIL